MLWIRLGVPSMPVAWDPKPRPVWVVRPFALRSVDAPVFRDATHPSAAIACVPSSEPTSKHPRVGALTLPARVG